MYRIMSVFQCLSCQRASFPVTREMVRLKPCALCASEARYACQCCINHQRRQAKGQIQSHPDQRTFRHPSPPPLNPRSFGSGPGGCQSSASPTEKLYSKRCRAVWQATAVRLSRGWQMFAPWRKSWCWRAGFLSGTQHRGLLVSLLEGKAGLHLPAIAMCEDVLFLQKPYAGQWGTSASCISYHFVRPGNISYLLFHGTVSNEWQDLALTALPVRKPEQKMWLLSCP